MVVAEGVGVGSTSSGVELHATSGAVIASAPSKSPSPRRAGERTEEIETAGRAFLILPSCHEPPRSQRQNAALAETPDGAPSGSTQRTLGFVAGGVGVAGLAVGAIFGLQAMSARKDAEPDCSSDLARCNQKGLDAVDDAKGKALISTVGFAAGGALVATGLVLVLTAPRNREASALTLNFSPSGALLSGGFQ